MGAGAKSGSGSRVSVFVLARDDDAAEPAPALALALGIGCAAGIDGKHIFCRIYSTLAGFIRCNRPNSPLVSHHCEDNLEKCEISEALIVEKAEGGVVVLGAELELELELAFAFEFEFSLGV
jgi:hypothetical protein